ncbi:ROK family protein [Wenxinia saemankumensis]|uniref:N-acetylglucosamine kinase n=1 Tax=Wenxinia saemankumensis TaxID=1447782 RepID=A0A1M6HP57_9RHOB|nr:ROK family protein [Wenxinia saemankumensis]SHJ23950.1 N-acetylglucosamine kinase [Wenxinia saemankumensis]
MSGPFGGIDLGGTKIEARLFRGDAAETITLHRIPTPQDSFESLLQAVIAQIGWLEAQAGGPVPVGLSVPGLIDPATGISFASNVPTTGRALGPELAEALGRDFAIVNDCMAFALSEATGGAGDGAASVMGLILGTGVGGGICQGGALPHRHAGLAVEVGHLGISARALARHGLPVWPCGCGQQGCMERYVSGTGLANLAEWTLGERAEAPELLRRDDDGAREVLDIWADLAGDALYAIQVMLDPDVIVLGGGLSNMPGVKARLAASLAGQRLGSARAPDIRVARHGDSSGARGAALVARARC